MINTNLTAVTLNGNGSATSFPFSFWVPNSEALQCWITDATGVLSQTTDFTAALTETGGTVVYPASGGSALPNGSKITIMRNMPFTQKVDFVNGVSFLAEVVETALDDLTAQVQQVAEAATRAVKVPVSSTVDPDSIISQLEVDAATASNAASAAAAQAQAATTQAQIAAQSATDAAASAVEAQTAVSGVRASATDTTPAPLTAKLQAGEGLELTLQNPGANENVLAAVDRRIISTARILNHSLNGGF